MTATQKARKRKEPTRQVFLQDSVCWTVKDIKTRVCDAERSIEYVKPEKKAEADPK